MSEGEYSSRQQEEMTEAESLSQQALQDICNEAVENIGQYSPDGDHGHDMQSYGSSKYDNMDSMRSPDAYNQESEPPSDGKHIHIESSPEGNPDWAQNQKYSGIPNRPPRDVQQFDGETEKSMSEREKEILQEFRDAAPVEGGKRSEHDRHHDFRTGSFNKGQQQGDGPYYSEAFSFSKDQVDPDTYQEHEIGESSRQNYRPGPDDRERSRDDSNYVDIGDRDIDIGELSGFQQLKMKNQMMLSTSQIINYHK